jgi:tRNA U34 5-methylaminomethyl-2-thiouridine-forming methyltransferase MnmC
MERLLQITSDGSHTISIPSLQVTYHSKHGAIQESMHVFIEAGLRFISPQSGRPVEILEMGLGTGLNALLTLIASENMAVRYESLEAYPIDTDIIDQLNYCGQLNRNDLSEIFQSMHKSDWEIPLSISTNFTLIKRKIKLGDYNSGRKFHLVYFDAFAPGTQPELWTTEIFTKLYNLMEENGVLVTYCSKSDVRRSLLASGFNVEKIPGPPGKREMLRAIRKNS